MNFKKFFAKYEWADLLYFFNAIILILALISLKSGPSFGAMALITSVILSTLGRYKRWWSLAYLPYILTLGVWIRIQNLDLLGNYPLALDPYYFLRLARTYLEQGHFPDIDMMRSAPIGHPSSTNFFALSIVFTFKFLQIIIPNISLELADILQPVIFFVLGSVAFFLLARKAFDKWTGIVATFFLVITPTYLHRTMAGFSDHESIALMFMFLCFWAFLSLSGSHKKRNYYWAFASGVFAVLMQLSWGGGSNLLYLAIVLYLVVEFLLNRLDLEKTKLLGWFILGVTLMNILWSKSLTSLFGQYKSIYFAPIIAFFAVGLIISNINYKIPGPYLLIISALGLVLFGFIIAPIKTYSLLEKIVYAVFIPLGTGRLTLTVAENRVPYLADWLGQFGFFLWVFLVGAITIAWNQTKKWKKMRWVLPTFVTLVFMTLLLSSKDKYSVMNGTSNTSLAFFLIGLSLSFGLLIFLYLYAFFKDKKLLANIKKLDGKALFMLIWLIAMMLSARGGLRVFIVLVPPACIMLGYLIATLGKKIANSKEWVTKLSLGFIILLIVIPLGVMGTASSYRQATYSGPGMNDQWQKAMSWVNKNTEKDSVFAHWWDYGYWVQTAGNRATVLDGGNAHVYWNHLLARHVLTGKTYQEALEFLYVHKVTHLLIISDEIGKYSAYSSIGSDEEFDIFSWISTFVMNPKTTEKKGDTTNYFFQGATNLDESFVYEKTNYTKDNSIIVGFKLPVKNDDDPRKMELLQPLAIINHAGSVVEVPVQCVYDGQKTEYEDFGIGGCVRIFPRILNARYQQENGALLWVSRRGLDALWTNLFLFEDKNPYFDLVYDDSAENRLAYYSGRTLGPLKIWKINYPENFTVNNTVRAEYLNTTTPYWEKLNEENSKNSPFIQ